MKQCTKDVYFHPGLGKVASTFLQYNFFPKLQGIRYIQRTKYVKAPEIIRRSGDEKFLISREFDKNRYLERESQFIAGHLKNVKPILILRRHDQWIASQYRRYAKNGFPLTFRQFFDIHTDQGRWQQHDLVYMDKIRLLEHYFDHKPLVLFFDQLIDNPYAFFDRLAGYMGASYNKKAINTRRRHTSYNEKQMRATRKVGHYINIQPQKRLKNPVLDKLRHWYVALVRYTVLYSALLIPAAWLGNEPLIPPEDLKKIHEQYADDWEQCLMYAKANNSV